MLCILHGLLILLGLAAAVFVIVSIAFKGEIKACFDRDPAATSFIEVLLTYAGLHAMISYRMAHIIFKARIPLLPRIMSQVAKWLTGIEIHPGAAIGEGLFIDHGMGVVIGETSVIGNNVTIFQGVTLGGTGKERGKRHPNIGDNVVIGTGAKILGNITVGDNSYIGANAVVIKDVPHNSTVVGVPGRITKQDGRKIDIALDHIHVLDPILQELEELKRRIRELEK
ncbi:MAG: serine O-acetyltransferase [Candidatus Omnitrophica bacterium]|nr:serine O-acetyltransferase [Candidatus Omnitrophota bacterium]